MDESSEAVDPRVKDQLEYLNSYTDEINSLELQLDDANATFRNTLSEYSQRLKLIAKKLGKCVRIARPYYEAEEAAQAAKLECEEAAIRYHRACSAHKEARETIAMAEKKFDSKKDDYQFDAAWQEMLNRETIKLMNAEALKEENELEHKRTTQTFSAAVEKVKILEQQLKKEIIKSRSYFEQKKVFLKVLQDLKTRVESLQRAVMDSKASYAACLHNLEMISSEIHERRKLNLPPREPGVGAEWDAKANAEISIRPPLSMIKVWDSESISSATETDVTSDNENLCQDLSLESSLKFTPNLNKPPMDVSEDEKATSANISRPGDLPLPPSNMNDTPSTSTDEKICDLFEDVDLNS
ncbi:SH3 domain-binding protein 5 homolog [Parasteatoda tepidariorum]|nr:SH3 domain-binding protein 5 homolog [Parasteatoda tepidariorum]XP_042901832.1 SH3 domain-binding protein 5 homolog [Parasteatoda tepidariorum]XP_042901836.1 SH3 domain-binding protein 5 homolog [Parasteatoda tepidariorum]